MRRRKVRSAAAATLWVALVAIGCSGPPDAPEDVARQFWNAVRTRDWETAQTLSAGSREGDLKQLLDDRPVESVLTGQILGNETTTVVETTLVGPVGRPPVSFDTHLTLYPDGWRVDVDETRSELGHAAFAANLEAVGNAIREGGRVLREVLQEGAAEAADALREVLEDLEDLLGDPPAPEPESI